MQTVEATRKVHLPLTGRGAPEPAGLDIDTELRRFEAEERQRLGLEVEERWVEDMANLCFTKREKSKITLIIGGLTMAHDYLVQGAFSHLGYNVVALDAPNFDALRTGKEFGNRGQCNPTYFTVGNLVKFLLHLRDEKGLSAAEIVDKYVFLTAGACGPCRFGMYVTEYRKALRDAGFDGFRVMLFQQQGGLSQATGEASGLELNPPFFVGLLRALIAGDVINGIGYRIRPYEVTPGATDIALEQAKKLCHDALSNGKSVLWALYQARKLFAKIEVNKAQPKPRCAIIGEFWAMTTEGDGNYKLQRFIEQEGGETDIQFVTAWILYNIWEVTHDTAQRAQLRGQDGGKYGLKGMSEFGASGLRVGLWLGDKALRAAFQTFAHTVGFHGYSLPDMHAIAELAHGFYNNDLRGGEGHMEVGKLILNVAKQKATMTLSVKPFGCMPSSGVSDGVQTIITERYPGTIFCAVETSGDGAVNFQSRVQMYLFKARAAAQAEFDNALSETGLSLEELRNYVKAHPRFSRALYMPAHRVASTAADFVYAVAEHKSTTPFGRAVAKLRGTAGALRAVVERLRAIRPEQAREAARLGFVGAQELAALAREKAPGLAESAAKAASAKLAEVLPFRPRGEASESPAPEHPARQAS
jgi:predicted nucleotide-binding protein (sugar kinase/HSP70/actin superfamily)